MRFRKYHRAVCVKQQHNIHTQVVHDFIVELVFQRGLVQHVAGRVSVIFKSE